MRPNLLSALQAFLADTAYAAQERVLEVLNHAGVTIVIPPTANRTEQREYDKDLSKARHLSEYFVANLKLSRAIATRYDPRAAKCLGAVSLTASVIWFN